MSLNFLREYQWTGHDSYRLPTFVDIRPELRPGKNVVCIKVESRRAPAKLDVTGEVLLWSGARIPLETDGTWQAEPMPLGLGNKHWTDPGYSDHDWRSAVSASAPHGSVWHQFNTAIYSRPFLSKWLRHPDANAQDSVWLRKTWTISHQPDDAWLRVVANRHYDLFFNGDRVQPSNAPLPELDTGKWVIQRMRGLDPQARPTLLDPDELGSPFVGSEYENPASGDPTANDFHSPKIRRPGRSDNDPTKSIDDLAGLFELAELDAKVHGERHRTFGVPEPVKPRSHHKDRGVIGYMAYDVSRLIHRGDNRIEIRLCEPDVWGHVNRLAGVAIDGATVTTDGRVMPLDGERGWQVCRATQLAAKRWLDVLVDQPAHTMADSLPRMRYRGAARASGWAMKETVRGVIVCALMLFGGVIAPMVAWSVWPWPLKQTSSLIHLARTFYAMLMAGSCVLFMAIVLEGCFVERHELMWYRLPVVWRTVCALSVGSMVLMGIGDLYVRAKREQLSVGMGILSIRRFPKSPAWIVLVFWVVVLSFFLRAYRLDFQPLDDDEYASVQAILSIAQTGIPNFVPDNVWYTRSPLYHYTVGAIVFLFGPTLWSLRLPSVLMGSATCWLTYLCGSHLLKSRWVGLGAMFMMAIHPFEIFTSHVARFYQMQQFMALLTIYCFCQGFVSGQRAGYRYMTVFCFLATVMSQEISCVMGIPLLIGYLVFAKEKSLRSNLGLIIASACALAVILLDYVVFKTRCLTRLEGISPNLEAMVKPHFWYPFNLFSLFIGYSRLHVSASVFLFLGIPMVCRERQKNARALYLVLFLGVLLTNLLVTHVSLRYQYWLFPIWALLSLEGLRALLRRISSYNLDLIHEPRRMNWWVTVGSFVVFSGILISWSPWRIAESYNAKLVGDSTAAMQYIRQHLRDEDQVMVTGPHTHAALLEIGKVDYDLSVPLLYDFAMLSDGKLIDRNGGAEIIGGLSPLMKVCRDHSRVWVAINREKLRNRGKNLRWGYPGARVELFLRRNCELMYETYLWSVFLWDANRGWVVPFREDKL